MVRIFSRYDQKFGGHYAPGFGLLPEKIAPRDQFFRARHLPEARDAAGYHQLEVLLTIEGGKGIRKEGMGMHIQKAGDHILA